MRSVCIRTLEVSERSATHLNDSSRSLFRHVLNGVLITQPVTTLHRIIHVPLPIILLHIAQRRIDPSLCACVSVCACVCVGVCACVGVFV